jgi:hypothetical protein
LSEFEGLKLNEPVSRPVEQSGEQKGAQDEDEKKENAGFASHISDPDVKPGGRPTQQRSIEGHDLEAYSRVRSDSEFACQEPLEDGPWPMIDDDVSITPAARPFRSELRRKRHQARELVQEIVPRDADAFGGHESFRTAAMAAHADQRWSRGLSSRLASSKPMPRTEQSLFKLSKASMSKCFAGSDTIAALESTAIETLSRPPSSTSTRQRLSP